MAAVRIFQIICDKFNVVKTCTSGNYTQKCVTNFYDD